jgi:hypothetical protein
MPNLQVVDQTVEQAIRTDRPAVASPQPRSGTTRTVATVIRWTVGIVATFALGSWLVWLTAYLQRHFVLEDIRSACQRVMPDTVERCVDTVIIQRGGARR